MARKTLALAAIAGLALALGALAFAPATGALVVCLVRQSTAPGASASCASWSPLMPELKAKFSPTQLPRRQMAGVAVTLGVGIRAGDELPPAIREMTFEFDRQTAFEAAGLPACPRRLLERLSVDSARDVCRESLVGRGAAHFATEDSPSEPIPLDLTLFNGGARGGVTTLLVHSATPGSDPTPVVVPVKLEKVSDGAYGSRATLAIPPIADGKGSLLDFTLRIKRRVRRGGELRSFAFARCFDERLQTRVDLVLSEDTRLSGTVLQPCTPTAEPAASSAG